MKGNATFLVVAVLAIILTLQGCYKEKDTVAEITVKIQNGSPVPGASVRVYGEGTVDQVQNQSGEGSLLIDQTKLTDGNGVVRFDFTNYYKPGQSGFAILSVDIVKLYPNDSLTARGVINVEEEKTTFKTFVVD